ncbi:hypothetical protein DUNSADRAFT_2852 [Dunaliella salina]|uniref:Encoded protein n=1 Tax=Dunaliella salina TaxID=3046 RepID=A0ABQ7GV47_DUNSA|nr:hypothetical protein DUNSADRAFT_2852 [Dunaliella salina]|eukprot:KAF5838458.1 hypothetical protein DUNSADRAFT_2852 [Dunaliella salina]
MLTPVLKICTLFHNCRALHRLWRLLKQGWRLCFMHDSCSLKCTNVHAIY